MMSSALTRIVLLVASASITGCGGAYSWREEALQPDGKIVTVSRSVKLGSRLSGEPVSSHGPRPITGWSLSVPLPQGGRAYWEGDRELTPMTAIVSGSSVYLVFSFFNCISYRRFESPVPHYVFLKYEGEQWRRIPFQELPFMKVAANLLLAPTNPPAKDAVDTGLVTVDKIKLGNRGIREDMLAVLTDLPPRYFADCP